MAKFQLKRASRAAIAAAATRSRLLKGTRGTDADKDLRTTTLNERLRERITLPYISIQHNGE